MVQKQVQNIRKQVDPVLRSFLEAGVKNTCIFVGFAQLQVFLANENLREFSEIWKSIPENPENPENNAIYAPLVITFAIVLPPRKPRIWGDRSRIRQYKKKRSPPNSSGACIIKKTYISALFF